MNAQPHIGHALEFVQADAIARYHQVLGDDVLYLCGSDENAMKNVQAAEKEGVPIQDFVNKNTKLFIALAERLNVHFGVFQQGSDAQHYAASQKLWTLCKANGDIYKKEYSGLYCVGCETFYTRDELNENGECFEHPGRKLEEVTEENYFFKLSAYQEKLTELIESDTIAIVPTYRKNEILAFLKRGLNDISISRSNERAKNWGVPVPDDSQQRMYVWFDALNIYQSGIGFGVNEDLYKKWWPADVQVIGKGIIRFHAVYWPAFLLSAKLALPKKLFVHEYITVNGQKMSKTLGNVIDPNMLIEKYGADSLRYFFLRYISPFADGDFSENTFVEKYNADLANGLGNLTARVAKLCETESFEQLGSKDRSSIHLMDVAQYDQAMRDYKFFDALNFVWTKIASLDKFIGEERPWEMAKKGDARLKSVLSHAVDQIQEIAVLLEPFMPDTAKRIEKQFAGPKVNSEKPLFPRIQ